MPYQTIKRSCLLALAVSVTACAGAIDDSGNIVEADDETQEIEQISQGLTGAVAANTIAKVVPANSTTGAIMYNSETGTTVLRRLALNSAVKIVLTTPAANGRYKVEYWSELNPALWGYMNGSELVKAANTPTQNTSAGRLDALKRARSAMGFSYYWGHGIWPKKGTEITITNGVATSNVGQCIPTGPDACPLCDHKGLYGSDCSHFVSTLWGVGGANTNPEDDAKGTGYSASKFNQDSAEWTKITPGAAKPGDVGSKPTHVWFVADVRNSSNVIKSFECISCEFNCKPSQNTVADTNTVWKMIKLNRVGWN